MAITVRETQNQSPAADTSNDFTTFTVSTAQIGDLIVVIQANDWSTLSVLQTPTGTAVTTWTLRQTFDGGSNKSHWKIWTGVCTTAGGTVKPNDSTTVERYAFVAVLASADYDASASASGNASTSHVAPSLTPAAGKTDDLLICHWTSNDGGSGVYNYTVPASMTATTERDVSPYITFRGATEQLASSSATGTRTATASASKAWCAVSILLKSATSSTDYAKTQTDPEGITDAPAATVTAARSQVDPVGVLDSETVVQTVARTQSDAVGLLDGVTAVIGFATTVTDPVGLLDDVTTSVDFGQTVSDDIGLLDDAGTTATVHVGLDDALGIDDAASDSLLDLTLDQLGIVDEIIVTMEMQFELTDDVGVTDRVPTGTQLLDPVGITDSIEVTRAATLEIDDLIGLSDVDVDTSHMWVTSVTDQLGELDDAGTAGDHSILLTDALGVTDLAFRPSTVRAIRVTVTGIGSNNVNRRVESLGLAQRAATGPAK